MQTYTENEVFIMDKISPRDLYILENIICYIVNEWKRITKKNIYQTHLYKILAIYDFRVLKRLGYPDLNIKYVAMVNGPVPIDIYDGKIKSEKFEIKGIGMDTQKIVIAKSYNKDLDFITDKEKKILDDVISIFSLPEYRQSKFLIEASHEEILAWQKHRASLEKGVGKSFPMSYADEAPGIEGEEAKEAFALYKYLHC